MYEIASKIAAASQQGSPSQKTKYFTLLLVGCVVLILQGCATTSHTPTHSEAPFDQAKIAYLANDYQRALAIVEPLAVTGEPWAQYTLGYMYYYGRGIAIDRQISKQWIERAALQGYAPAQEALRLMSSPTPKQDEDIESSIKPPSGDKKDAATPADASPQQTQGKE
jgi:TPR repeat protein